MQRQFRHSGNAVREQETRFEGKKRGSRAGNAVRGQETRLLHLLLLDQGGLLGFDHAGAGLFALCTGID